MMSNVREWCTACKSFAETCLDPGPHRSQGKYRWRADYLLGGRHGERIRKIFKKGVSKMDATKKATLDQADFERGTYLPKAGRLSKTPFAEFCEIYRDKYVSRHVRSPKTECYTLDHLKEFWKDRPLHTLTLNDAEEYIDVRMKPHMVRMRGGKERKGKGISNNAMNREITTIKSMFRWAVEREYLRSNPFEKLPLFERPGSRARWFSDSEFDLLKHGCQTLKDFDMIDILDVACYSGFRKGNLQRINANDIVGNRLQALQTKNNRPYDVPIGPKLRPVLDKLVRMRPVGPLLNFKNFRKRWDRLVKFVGLYKPGRHPDNATIHVCRHTFVSQALRAGIPIHLVSEWADHASVDFTKKVYGHICPKQEDQEMNKLQIGQNTSLSVLA